MKDLGSRLYALYAFVILVLLFLLFFPLLLVPIYFPRRFALVGIVNRWWGVLMFNLWFIPVLLEFRFKYNTKDQYIFCPNHFSYLDIPAMALNPFNTIFVGKNDMETIPLFGFMYRKLHITVDRAKLKSRYSTYERSRQALEEGKSLVIFPEGGIVSTNFPAMAPFKDGAFRLSVEKGIPVVPVTIHNNWLILKENPFRLSRGRVKMIFHKPVKATANSAEEIKKMKATVYQVIQNELNNEHKS
jgi:1-acyl-sn-glycerol-3-phosphate acyltransferase